MRTSVLAAVAAASFLSPGGVAVAQTACYDHNGSMMRATARGDRLTIVYARPKPVLRNAGVRPGTVLVTATLVDDGIVGVARVFSKSCPGAPLEYNVTGYYIADTNIYLTGRRDVHSDCRPTGRRTTDELEFDYRSGGC